MEADALAAARAHKELIVPGGKHHADELVALPEAKGNQAALSDVVELAHGRFLDDAAPRCKHKVFALCFLGNGEHGVNLFAAL